MTKHKAAPLSGTLLARKGSAAPATEGEPPPAAAQDGPDVIEPTEIVPPREASADGAALDPSLLSIDPVDVDCPPFQGSGNLPVRTGAWRRTDSFTADIEQGGERGQRRRRYLVAAAVIIAAILVGWSANGFLSDSDDATSVGTILPPAAAARLSELDPERALPARAGVARAAIPEPIKSAATIAGAGENLETRPLAEFGAEFTSPAGGGADRVLLTRDIESPIAPLQVALIEVARLEASPQAAPAPAIPQVAPRLAAQVPDPSPVPLRKPDAPDGVVVAALQGGLYIQLGSVKTAAGAEREWERLVRDFPAILAGMDLRVERANVPNRGAFFRIRTGPISSLIQARTICAEFAARSRGCLVVRK